MVERYFSVSRVIVLIGAVTLAACSTTPGRTGPAPVDDVSIGRSSTQTVGSVSSGQPVPGGVADGAPIGGSISSEEIRSDNLMGGATGAIPEGDISLPRDAGRDRSLAMASQSPVITNLMQSADMAYTERRWEDAASVLERALRIEPANGLLWQRLAEVRFAQGDYLQTVQLASKSDALAGTSRTLRTDNLILMIESYEAMGDFDRADSLRQNASERVNRTSR